MQQNVLDNEEGNCIFSPLSAALSLSLVTYGAKGGTKEILTDLLIGNDAGFSIDEFLRWVLRIQRKIQVFKNLFFLTSQTALDFFCRDIIQHIE
jgi:serine protease inhibitor